ncbi:hypothetical protein H5410_004311 [Solanum commersonii]|uniref:Uncharacterized protein n=1 Tax=Solanum commersonii TaxID=4109 RepID=A0A9J6B7N0_SOLCO|nr:hypothetical protein H5410_004311 [Solanum commersonii]
MELLIKLKPLEITLIQQLRIMIHQILKIVNTLKKNLISQLIIVMVVNKNTLEERLRGVEPYYTCSDACSFETDTNDSCLKKLKK